MSIAYMCTFQSLWMPASTSPLHFLGKVSKKWLASFFFLELKENNWPKVNPAGFISKTELEFTVL